MKLSFELPGHLATTFSSFMPASHTAWTLIVCMSLQLTYASSFTDGALIGMCIVRAVCGSDNIWEVCDSMESLFVSSQCGRISREGNELQCQFDQCVHHIVDAVTYWRLRQNHSCVPPSIGNSLWCRTVRQPGAEFQLASIWTEGRPHKVVSNEITQRGQRRAW